MPEKELNQEAFKRTLIAYIEEMVVISPTVESLQTEYYDYCYRFLTEYKDRGLQQSEMLELLMELTQRYPKLAGFIHEVADMVVGYTGSHYRVFLVNPL